MRRLRQRLRKCFRVLSQGAREYLLIKSKFVLVPCLFIYVYYMCRNTGQKNGCAIKRCTAGDTYVRRYPIYIISLSLQG